MASRSFYATMFVPILAVLILVFIGFIAVYTPAVMRATVRDPQTAAGVAQIAGVSSPAEQYESVTTGARPLSESEEARPLPQGQPQNLPQASPQRAPQRTPDTPR